MKRAGPTSVALLGAVGAVLWVKPANAYCRETTSRPRDNYDPQVSGCWVGTDDAGLPAPALYWRNANVSYSFEQDVGQFVPLSDAEGVALQAFAAWTSNAWCADAGGAPSIRLLEFPQVTCDEVPTESNPFRQYNNPIIFRQGTWPYDSVNALGYTTLTFDPDTGEILGATIEINATHPIVVDPDGSVPDGSYDLASILTHEAGHFLGMAHSADTSAVMYAYYHPPTTTLRSDDLAGICSLYPPDQTRATSTGSIGATQCDPTPANGFSHGCAPDAGDLTTSTCRSADDGGLDGGDASDPPQPCANDWLFACALAPATTRGGGGALASAGGLVLAGWLRRIRAASRRSRASRGVLGICVALGLLLGSPGDANASVSFAVLLDDLARRATAVAVVTPIESRAAWEDGRIVTYTRARVDRVAAGHAPLVVTLRAFGGVVGRVGQRVEGEATFENGRPALVFLSVSRSGDAAAVVEGAQGEFPILESAGRKVIATAPNLGALIRPPGPTPPGATGLARAALEGHPLDEAVATVESVWSRVHER